MDLIKQAIVFHSIVTKNERANLSKRGVRHMGRGTISAAWKYRKLVDGAGGPA